MIASATTIFISRIQGLPVLDSSGDQVGKVRDVVTQLGSLSRPPRIKGLVVELFARRRVFLPMVRVHSIAADHVAINGVVDTRRFERREAETLVIDGLYDRTITRKNGKPATIFDVAMKEVRAREWEINEVALREESARRLGIRQYGPVFTVPWAEVAPRLVNSAQQTDQKVAELVDMKPADVARELHDMEPDRRAEVAQALADDQLADAFQELPEDEQIDLINSLELERAADVLEEMDPDDAADLISELPQDVAEDLLQRMEPNEAKDVRNLLSYAEYTAGGMMTPEPIILAVDATVAEALARARNEEITPALASMVYICRPPLDTPSGRYIGAVHLQRLLREPPSIMASALLDTNLTPLPPEADLFQVSRYFATYNLVSAPVVNKDGQLVGAVTVDDVVDHMLPDDWRGDQMDGLSPAEDSPEVNRG